MRYFRELNKYKCRDIFSLSDRKSLWLEKRVLDVKIDWRNYEMTKSETSKHAYVNRTVTWHSFSVTSCPWFHPCVNKAVH
jgi:hypothetical protein